MKTKLIYSFAMLCMAFTIISCDEKDDKSPEIAGAWNYSTPHFLFEYAQDSVSITMAQGKKKSIAVDDLKATFLGMATEKMKEYFTGVEFNSGNQMRIKMQMKDGAQSSLNAAYIQSDGVIGVTLDADDLKELTGSAMQIPSISFKYTVNNDRLLMYFDQVYVQTVVSMMQDKIVDMIIPMMGVDVTQLPESVVNQMKEGIKTQIPVILDQIIRLEIGFNLTRESVLK